ncbi:unannotated protein [freshwater metagenome]|uniref:Unannotated protein n=1 Tax=freshwater metagenome TaxID=449393 RepID=A0A6J6PJY2_9ZZZZ
MLLTSQQLPRETHRVGSSDQLRSAHPPLSRAAGRTRRLPLPFDLLAAQRYRFREGQLQQKATTPRLQSERVAVPRILGRRATRPSLSWHSAADVCSRRLPRWRWQASSTTWVHRIQPGPTPDNSATLHARSGRQIAWQVAAAAQTCRGRAPRRSPLRALRFRQVRTALASAFANQSWWPPETSPARSSRRAKTRER